MAGRRTSSGQTDGKACHGSTLSVVGGTELDGRGSSGLAPVGKAASLDISSTDGRPVDEGYRRTLRPELSRE